MATAARSARTNFVMQQSLLRLRFNPQKLIELLVAVPCYTEIPRLPLSCRLANNSFIWSSEIVEWMAGLYLSALHSEHNFRILRVRDSQRPVAGGNGGYRQRRSMRWAVRLIQTWQRGSGNCQPPVTVIQTGARPGGDSGRFQPQYAALDVSRHFRQHHHQAKPVASMRGRRPR